MRTDTPFFFHLTAALFGLCLPLLCGLYEGFFSKKLPLPQDTQRIEVGIGFYTSITIALLLFLMGTICMIFISQTSISIQACQAIVVVCLFCFVSLTVALKKKNCAWLNLAHQEDGKFLE